MTIFSQIGSKAWLLFSCIFIFKKNPIRMSAESQRTIYAAECNGRACPKCFKCRDWYYTTTEHSDCNASRFAYQSHVGPLVGPLYRWIRRPDATCGYHAYPHYVYSVIHHGQCRRRIDCTSKIDSKSCHGHGHSYPCSALHSPAICHCDME